jgi:glutamate racemase
MPDPRPIGVFDSGLGGLTVLRDIRARLPGERLVYLGDTARVPYGTKSAATVTRYAMECAGFLARRDIKALAVACNTASALAIETLRAALKPRGIPVLGVIEPGAVQACRASRSGRVGVIGTASTIRSAAYPRAIAAIRPDFQVTGAACPLFVPLAEEGWTDRDDTVAHAAAMRYLRPLAKGGIDTLILGCTHYPLLREVIEAALAELVSPGHASPSESVVLVDSGEVLAADLARLLSINDAAAPPDAGARPDERYFVTDDPERFAALSARFLGREIPPPQVAELDARDALQPGELA